MTSDGIFEQCNENDIHGFLADVAREPIRAALLNSSGMQRLRITSLPESVMEPLCDSLQGDSRWTARMLSDASKTTPWKTSATKIIELRNTLETPLLVFIPNSLRTAAEDSLDIATFSELSLFELTRDLVQQLTKQLPEELKVSARQILDFLRLERVTRNLDEEVEFLLTIRKNGFSRVSFGRSLFIFGLIPDDNLLNETDPLRRLSLNIRACEELTNSQRPLRERIGRLPVQSETIQKTLFAFLRSRQSSISRTWTKEIACDPRYSDFNLAHWIFDEQTDRGVRLVLEPLELPIQTPDPVSGAARMPVLDLNGRQNLKVSVRLPIKASDLPSWKSFRIQLLTLADEGPTVVWESNSYPKPTGRNQKFSRTIKLSDLVGIDEGTYFLKIDAYDQNGALLTDRRAIDPEKPEGRAENESDYFLITSGIEQTDVEAPSPRLTRVSSLLDAYFVMRARQFLAKEELESPPSQELSGAWNQAVGASLRGEVFFELEQNTSQSFGVVVPSVFRRLELAILRHPEQLGMLRVDCIEARELADLQEERRDYSPLPKWREADEFLAARATLFAEIYGQHIKRRNASDQESIRAGIVETADLLSLKAQILQYAQSYCALAKRLLDSQSINRESPGALRTISQIDIIEVGWYRSAGDPGRALLLSPTHPLRLLWHLQHGVICERAISNLRDGQKVPYPAEFLRQIRQELVPANLPLILLDSRGRGYVDNGALTSHWSIYLPEGRNGDQGLDVSACRDRFCNLLGIKSPQILISGSHDKQIALRLADYLEQHPYVEQLRINVFNPGDGNLLVGALRAIEREQVNRKVLKATNLLRYSVQMFGEGEAHLEGMGEALELLLDPERQAAEGDEFALAATNHLLPKLVFARNTIKDFIRSPKSFPAHVTIFLEHFNAKSKLFRAGELRRGSFVAGLVQEPELALEIGDERFQWAKGVRPIPSDEPIEFELDICTTYDCAQRLQAATAAGQPQPPEILPAVSLHLDAEALGLLKHSHEVSDWVLTIDRHLGVEYFDSGRTSEEFGYLLDFSPATLQADRPRFMLSTLCGWELAGLLQPVFDRLAWPLTDCHTEVVLESLRSLSGRLAFRLLGCSHHVDETASLLLSRWLLERADLLVDRIIIPLDAHLSWFKRPQDESGESLNLSEQRADLLLVSFDIPTATVRITVVEVKLRKELSLTERGYLYRVMREQADNTIRCLRERFDPELYPEPRADLLLCAKELTTTLAFYVRRALRYGLISEQVANSALDFVDRLDAGYRIDFRAIGVVFEQNATGPHVDEDEPGFQVHRFGSDVAASLFRSATVRCRQEPPIDGAAGSGDGSVSAQGVTSAESSGVTPSEFDSLRSALKTSNSQLGIVADKAESTPSSVSKNPAVPEKQSGKPNFTEEVRETPDVDVQRRPDSSSGDSKAASPGLVEPDRTKPPAMTTDRQPTRPEILLGANEVTSQHGILGKFGEAKVGIDLSGCNTISLFGVQGFGKSYTLGVIAEMAAQAVTGINLLPKPLATVIFHYHKSDAYAPEFATATQPNRKPREIAALLENYAASPRGLSDVVLLTPEAKLSERKREFPAIEIQPIRFNSGELGVEGWKFLLGAYGNDSLYMRQLVNIMRRHRQGLTLDRLEQEIREADLSTSARRLAEDRISLARPYIDDTANLREVLRPGRTVIVDLRDEWIEKDEALGLFVAMLRIFGSSKFQGHDFNKLVVFDEAHKYITESELIGQVVETIREMRHQATSVLIASQDPLSVPRAVIELTSLLILHRMTSPQWLKHLKSAITALDEIKEGHLSALQPGEALVWAQRSTDKRFTQRPQKIAIRPRFSQHGGGTKTAVEGETIR